MNIVLNREYKGFYRLSIAKRGFIKTIIIRFHRKCLLKMDHCNQNPRWFIWWVWVRVLQCFILFIQRSFICWVSWGMCIERSAERRWRRKESYWSWTVHVKYCWNVFLRWATELKALEKEIDIEMKQLCERILSSVIDEHLNTASVRGSIYTWSWSGLMICFGSCF